MPFVHKYIPFIINDRYVFVDKWVDAHIIVHIYYQFINSEQDNNMNNTDNQILQRALDAFEREVGEKPRVLKAETETEKADADAVIKIGDQKYYAEIKRWAPQANFGALIYQIRELPGHGLLIADYINKKMAARLKAEGIQFLDTAGNAYLKQKGLHINVRGNDPKEGLAMNNTVPAQRRGTGRAFTPTGMRVVFEFLKYPDLANAPYREIAERTGVALGTVGWVTNDLKAQGIILDRGGENRIEEWKVLLDKWVEAYPLKLRPKFILGRFKAENPYWWQDLGAEILNAQWGGEIAAARLTKYLKPQIATLYTRENLVEIARLGHLRKANRPEEVNVEILKPYWEVDEPGENVHPIVVYADLIATSDARNLEVAKLIYDEFIAEHRR